VKVDFVAFDHPRNELVNSVHAKLPIAKRNTASVAGIGGFATENCHRSWAGGEGPAALRQMPRQKEAATRVGSVNLVNTR
jgi:hypothetical protein